MFLSVEIQVVSIAYGLYCCGPYKAGVNGILCARSFRTLVTETNFHWEESRERER